MTAVATQSRTTPASSWVEADVYDPATKSLYLKTQSGKHYRYDGVESGVYAAYAAMSSAGQAFNKLIKGHYTETAIAAADFDAQTTAASQPTTGRGRLKKATKARAIWRKKTADGRLLGYWF